MENAGARRSPRLKRVRRPHDEPRRRPVRRGRNAFTLRSRTHLIQRGVTRVFCRSVSKSRRLRITSKSWALGEVVEITNARSGAALSAISRLRLSSMRSSDRLSRSAHRHARNRGRRRQRARRPCRHRPAHGVSAIPRVRSGSLERRDGHARRPRSYLLPSRRRHAGDVLPYRLRSDPGRHRRPYLSCHARRAEMGPLALHIHTKGLRPVLVIAGSLVRPARAPRRDRRAASGAGWSRSRPHAIVRPDPGRQAPRTMTNHSTRPGGPRLRRESTGTRARCAVIAVGQAWRQRPEPPSFVSRSSSARACRSCSTPTRERGRRRSLSTDGRDASMGHHPHPVDGASC